jgi:hypothetical protein
MLLIAHRGNIQGPTPSLENNPSYVLEAIDSGFSVEIDLRVKNNKFYLGHDYAQYKVDEKFLTDNKGKLWVHCKDSQAFEKAIALNLNCFWHNIDDYTMTSYGYVWCFPGKEPVGKMSIAVLPELYEEVSHINLEGKVIGICSDYVLDIKNI